MINPGAIPSIPGDMDALAAHASQLSRTGGDFSRTGEQVNHTWQGLSGVYRAPEAGQLFAATAPVQSVSASVGADIEAAGAALAGYASEVKQIKARLESLRAQAQAFVASVQGKDDWQSDSSKVDQNNQLIDAVSTEMAAFFDAQRRCANAINALYGGMQYQADNGDGTTAANEYGYTAQQLHDAAKQGAHLPWGSDEKHDGGFWGDVGDFFGGMWDGAKQMVTGLGALIGYSNGHFSWSTAGTAWTGLGKFALAAGIYTMPGGVGIGLDQSGMIPGLKRGELGRTLATAGKGLVAWDEWSKDPSRAAGTATFNVVTAIVGTKGAGAALKGAGTAAEASDLATVAKVGSVMTRGGELLTKMPTVSDLAGKAFGKLPMFRMPEITAPEVKIPEHVDTPHTPDVSDTHPGSVGDGLRHTPHLPDTRVPEPRLPEHLPSSTPHIPGHADVPHAPDVHNGHPTDPVGAPHEHGGSPAHHDPAGHDPAAHHDPSTGGHEHNGGPHGSSHDAGHTDHSTHPAHDGLPPGAAGDHAGAGGHGDGAPPVHPVAPGNQPDGSWIGEEHGRRFALDPAANRAADHFLSDAAQVEPRLSDQIHSIANHVPGARMRGYPDFVLKSAESFKRKLATELLEFPNRSLEGHLAGMKDSVRYTMEIPAGDYADGVSTAVHDLQAHGFENVTFKPSWHVPDGYKGLNSTWRDPETGRVFELQFHTPESFEAKMQTHELYEAQRLPGVPESEVARLKAEQGELFHRVPVPDDVVGRLNELKEHLDATRPGAAVGDHLAHHDVSPPHDHALPQDHASAHHDHAQPGADHDHAASGHSDGAAAHPTDWSGIVKATEANSEPAVHAGTATPAQAARYIAEHHPYMHEVNAERYQHDVDGSLGFRQNCTRCTLAVDNGFVHDAPSSALPLPNGPDWPGGSAASYVRMLGGNPADFRMVHGYDEIIRDIQNRGVGARGVVYVDRGLSAHVFNVVHDDVGVVFLDGQTGGLGTLEQNVRIGYIPLGK
jgi:hypothetical protein